MAKRGRKAKTGLGIDLTAIKPPDFKTAAVRLRLTPEEAAQMKQAATLLGTSLSDYIRQMHAQAWAALKGRKGL